MTANAAARAPAVRIAIHRLWITQTHGGSSGPYGASASLATVPTVPPASGADGIHQLERAASSGALYSAASEYRAGALGGQGDGGVAGCRGLLDGQGAVGRPES